MGTALIWQLEAPALASENSPHPASPLKDCVRVLSRANVLCSAVTAPTL